MTLPGPWSYSSLKKFKTCPKQFAEVKVFRNFKEPEFTEATLYGKEFHTAAEKYIRDGIPLPEAFAYVRSHLDTLRNIEGEKFCEVEMGLTKDLTPCGFRDPNVWARGVADLLIVNRKKGIARVVDYKGLDVDTPIPTPRGFVRMGDLRVGDSVFGTDGLPYPITGKSEVKSLPCYEVQFSNGVTVVCDQEHLWGLTSGSVLNVRELKPKDRIPLSSPVAYATEALPVDPYVLGFWLADGSRNSGEVTKNDQFMFGEIVRRGYILGADTSSHDSQCETRTIKGIRRQLTTLGLLNSKHIPELYKKASYAQRVDLIRGIMDGDGYANPVRKQAVLNIVDKRLSDDVREVLESLGVRCLQSTTIYRGFGKVGTAYPLSFRPIGFNPFLTPKKAAVAEAFFGGRDYLEVSRVVPVPSRPTQCISVGSPNRMYLCTKHYVPTHNTGKSAKYADTAQLELMALMVFKHFPEITKVKAGLLFVVANHFKPAEYVAAEEKTYWRQWMQDVGRLEQAHRTGVWNPSPSGLCKRHCVVETCPHNGG
jgi:hypothetical protein